MRKELRVYIIGVEPIDEHTYALIEGSDFCLFAKGVSPRVGFQFDSGDRWGRVEILRFESTRIAICARV